MEQFLEKDKAETEEATGAVGKVSLEVAEVNATEDVVFTHVKN